MILIQKNVLHLLPDRFVANYDASMAFDKSDFARPRTVLQQTVGA